MNTTGAARKVLSDELISSAPQTPLELVTPVYERPWYWPFEPRRLVVVHALKMALVTVLLTLVVRGILSGTLWLTNDEAVFWQLAREFHLSYNEQPPLAYWLTGLSTLVFGNHLMAIRLPTLLCSFVATVWLLRLTVRFGWAKGADAVASLCVATPLLFLSGVLAGTEMLLLLSWIGMMETSYSIGMGYDRRKSAWLKLAAFASLGLLTEHIALVGIISSLVWLLSAPHGRRGLMRIWPYALAALLILIFAVSTMHFSTFDQNANNAADFNRYGRFWIMQLFLIGPGLIIGTLSLFEARHQSRFLATWAICAAAAFFVLPLYVSHSWQWSLFVYIPVIVYFGKLAASNRKPRLVRFTLIAGAILTVIGAICLFVRDPGWAQFDSHLSQLPAQARALKIVADNASVAAQARFALKEESTILERSKQTELPATFLYLVSNQSASSQMTSYDCDEYSRVHDLHLLYCKHRVLNEQPSLARDSSAQAM